MSQDGQPLCDVISKLAEKVQGRAGVLGTEKDRHGIVMFKLVKRPIILSK